MISKAIGIMHNFVDSGADLGFRLRREIDFQAS
jgi:hypothetical protein